MEPEEADYEALKKALTELRTHKPEERSEKARQYAVTITELEKVIGYFKMFVIDGYKG